MFILLYKHFIFYRMKSCNVHHDLSLQREIIIFNCEASIEIDMNKIIAPLQSF